MQVELTQNYFELFGLPIAFQIDNELLSVRYRELQRSNHPDRFAHASDKERRFAVQKAALINEAYTTLQSPLRRARYMLQQRGIVLQDEQYTSSDKEFLMEQMELREALSDVKTHEDPMAALDKLIKQINERDMQLQNELSRNLGNNDLNLAKELMYKLQFIEKLKQECEETETRLLDAI